MIKGRSLIQETYTHVCKARTHNIFSKQKVFLIKSQTLVTGPNFLGDFVLMIIHHDQNV